MNRVLTARMANLHFASTPGAARNLESEDVARHHIHVTGNSGIDAVLHVKGGLEKGTLQGADWPQLHPAKKLIVVTAHRRESFGDGFENICAALAELAGRDDVQIVYPVHRNPNVLDPVNRKLANLSNVFLVPPLDYVAFCRSDTARLYAHLGLWWGAGGSTLARKADIGVARHDRAPGSRGSRYRPRGGKRKCKDRQGG